MPDSEHRSIYWLASYPKSGNTWVRYFLDCYVTGFPVNFSSAYKYVNLDHDNAMLQGVSMQSLFEMDLMTQVVYQPAMYANMLRAAKTKDIVLKTHNANVSANGMPLIPVPLTGGAIYIIRDPRDVVLSYAAHLGLSVENTALVMNDVNHAAHSQLNMLHHLMSSWTNHVKTWTNDSLSFPVTVIKYEDLLTDTKSQFERILKVLKIAPISRKSFNFALKQTTFESMSAMEKKQGFIERNPSSKEPFFRKGTSGQWKTLLDRTIHDRIVQDHSAAMRQFGYLT